MEERKSENTSTSHGEVDLGQIIALVNKFFSGLFTSFLRFFIYLKKRLLILGILLLIGGVLGYISNRMSKNQYKTEIIVKPNFESKNYLNDVLAEISNNLFSNDTTFFQNIGIQIVDLEGFSITIEPIEEKKKKKVTREDIQYTELLLENFTDESFEQELAKSELFKKSFVHYRITFTYVKQEKGMAAIQKLFEYINDNEFFQEIGEVYRENASLRIQNNKKLINQIDMLVDNYTTKLGSNTERLSEGTVYLAENNLNITDLLNLKNRLIKDVEEKKLDLVEQKKVIKIINFGKSQQSRLSLTQNKTIIYPLILILGYFLVALVIGVNRKAKELEP